MSDHGSSHVVSGLPPWAAWRHAASTSLEFVFIRTTEKGFEFEGVAGGSGDHGFWRVDYLLAVDHRWVTRRAKIVSRCNGQRVRLQLESDADGTWRVDGLPVPEMRGCIDVDLEISALTNSLPIRRLSLRVEEAADVPAVYVRAPELRLERLEQRYARCAGDPLRYRYDAPRFNFTTTVSYDDDGLVRDYPGIAQRAL